MDSNCTNPKLTPIHLQLHARIHVRIAYCISSYNNHCTINSFFNCWSFCLNLIRHRGSPLIFKVLLSYFISIYIQAIPNLLRALFAYQEFVACSNPELSSLDLCDITGYVVLSIHAVERVILYVKHSTVTQTVHSPDKLKSLWKSATELTLVLHGFCYNVCCFSQACVCVLPLDTLSFGPLLVCYNDRFFADVILASFSGFKRGQFIGLYSFDMASVINWPFQNLPQISNVCFN